MAEVVEQVKIVKKEDIPEEMAGFERLGLNERHELVGIDDEGNLKRVPRVGAMLLKLALETGVAEEMPIETSSPEIAEIQRLHNQEIETLKQQHERKIQELKDQHTQEMEKLRHEFDTKLDDQSQRISQLTTTIETLTAQLEEKNILTPKDRAVVREGLSEPPLDEEIVSVKTREAGEIEYLPGEEVAIQRPDKDNKFMSGFVVADRKADPGKNEIWVKNINHDLPFPVHKSKVMRLSDVPAEELLVVPSGSPSAAMSVTRERYQPRETVWRRLRNTTPWGVEERDYYVDDRGTYYLEDGEPIHVSREVIDGRTVGVAALAAAGIVVVAAWELVGEKIFGFGDGSSHELRQVIHNQAIQINDLHKINNHVSGVKNHLSGEISDLQTQIARDHTQEMNGINSLRHRLNESNTITGYKFAFRYPWDWAANRVGAYRAESWLHTLAGRAAQHGHRIRWIFNGYEPNGSVREILQVDGTTNTQKVVQVVSQFR